MAIITISRGSYAGGKQLAECLSKSLNYRIISREILVEGAKRYGVSESRLAEALEQPPKFWEKLKHERRLYLAIVQAALCDEIKECNVVYHGHAGHLLLKGLFQVIRVRVVAPFENRVKFLVETNGMTKSEAAHYIKKKDKEREKWTRFLYGVDREDPSLYDLIINLENIEIDCACKIVQSLINKKNSKLNQRHRQILDNLILTSHVRAALALDTRTAAAEVDVSADNGIVHLAGQVQSEIVVERALEVVDSVPGVKGIARENFVGTER